MADHWCDCFHRIFICFGNLLDHKIEFSLVLIRFYNIIPLQFWGCGGTGRHAWLRTKCRKAWGFDSLHPYQYNKKMKKFVIGFFIFISLSSFIFVISYLNPGVSLPILPSANAEIKEQENLSWFSRAALDFYFDINILRKADAGYVAIFAKNGRIIHATAKGMADIDKRIPMQTNTRFRIASMTKPITAVATLILIEEGKLKLDDPIEQYFPLANKIRVALPDNQMLDNEFVTEPLKRSITILDLLTFSSGAGYNDSVDNKDQSELAKLWAQNDIFKGLGSLEDRVNKILQLPFFEQPGEIWRYGWSTDILARIIEVASQKSFYQFLEERIFKLDLYSKKLTLQFQFYLLETKKFHQNKEIMNEFIDAFIEKKFGSSKLITKLSKFLIENKNKKETLYLNKLVKVVGSKSEKKIVDAFFKQFPDVEHEFISRLKKMGGSKFIVTSDNENFQKIILVLAVVLLILFLIYSS